MRSPNGDERVLIDDAYFARYVRSGHIVYGRPDGLYAAPFDLANLQLAGPPVLVVDKVLTEPVDATIEFAASDDGTLVYMPAVPLDGRRLTWVDRKGQVELLPTPPRAYEYPTLSPDGKRVAFQIKDGVRHDIWVYEFSTAALNRITLDGTNTRPMWTPDGRRVAYASRRPDGRHIMWQPLDGTEAATSIVKSYNRVWPGTWTPGGERLIFVEDPPTSLDSLKVLRIGSTDPPGFLLSAPPPHLHPHLSPNGQWLAYTVFERGPPQVFIRPLAGGSARQITPSGGGQPRWSRDGTELFYRTLDSVMRISIRTTPELQLGRAEKLFNADYVGGLWGPPDYDVTADGKRFLFVKRDDAERTRLPIHVVLNWGEELRRRVPVAR